VVASEAPAPPLVLIGGVGQLYQGDLDVGRLLVEELGEHDLGPGVVVEDLHYGAVAVVQRLQELKVQALVLVGAEQRGRRPGTVDRRVVIPEDQPVERVQAAVGDAVTGYVGIDLIIEVAHALGVLPSHTVAIEVEPVLTVSSEALSNEVTSVLGDLVDLIRAEVQGLGPWTSGDSNR
jgi:hypothetical protein